EEVAMANFIVLRLVPAAPVDAGTFTNYLSGLTVNIYDISFAHPKAGTPGDPTPPIGFATFNAPNFVTFPAPFPPPPPLVTYPAATTIVQHFAEKLVPGFITDVDMQAVATAVIPYVAPVGAEYPNSSPAPDLRIRFLRGGTQDITDPDVYYDVK